MTFHLYAEMTSPRSRPSESTLLDVIYIFFVCFGHVTATSGYSPL